MAYTNVPVEAEQCKGYQSGRVWRTFFELGRMTSAKVWVERQSPHDVEADLASVAT